MIDERIENIMTELVNIKRDYRDVEKKCIDFECSTELNIGSVILKWGTMWKIVTSSKNLEECVERLSDLYKTDMFSGWETEIKDIINKVVNACVNRRDKEDFGLYTLDIQMELEHKFKDLIWENC